MFLIQNLMKKISKYVFVNDRPYLSLSGTLTQAGTAAPTMAVQENSIGVIPTLARSGTGVYTLTIPGQFASGKVLLPSPFVIDNATALIYGSWARTSADVLTLSTLSAHATAADLVASVDFEVKVYQ